MAATLQKRCSGGIVSVIAFAQEHVPRNDFVIISARMGGELSGCRKRGVEFKGVVFMTVFSVLTVLAVLESTLPSFCFSYKMQYQEAAVTLLTVLTGLAVSAVTAVSVVTATPLKLNPPFAVILKLLEDTSCSGGH